MKMRERPTSPTDQERTLWWRTKLPTDEELVRWQQQVTVDLNRKWGIVQDDEDLEGLCEIPGMMLPGEAFENPVGQSPVKTFQQEVAQTWLWSGGDAWTVAFASRLAGHGQPEVADALRQSLRNGHLPSLLEQTVLNRVLGELTLREWVDIAVCEEWSMAQAAEIARNAGCWKPEICQWMNSHADATRLPEPQGIPAAEAALETKRRCRKQPLKYAVDGG